MEKRLFYRWYSFCSAHQEHQEDCLQCQAGTWEFEPFRWLKDLYKALCTFYD